jgi:ribonuclease D
VVYLGKLYLQLRGRLSDRERLQWLAADFASLADPITYAPDPGELWKKVKGRQHLRGRQLAVLRALAQWREQQARERDLPRKWLLKDDVMVELCRRLPRNLEALTKVRGVEAGLVRREGKPLLQLIADACQLDKDQWPREKGRPKPLTPQQEAMVDLLSACLHLLAARHQLSPQAIGTQKDLQKLVRGENDCKLLSGWRQGIAGDPLQAVMRGELNLRNIDGELVLR